MPIVALIAIFIVVPIAELYVILQVGDAIGVPLTIAILVADSILGSLLLKSQGRTVWRRFNQVLSEGGVPTGEVADGALVIFGGAFLITPGFLTDVIGVLLLLPPTRAVIRKLVLKRVGERIAVSTAGRRRSEPGDVDGTAYEVREPRGDLPAR